MKLDTALYQLRTSPMAFLQNNLLHLSGKAVSGEHLGYFCRYRVDAGPNEGFSVEWTPASASYAASEAAHGSDTYKMIPVQNLRMIPRTEGVDPSSLEPYILGLGGSDIMITGQLNACTFAVRQEVGQLVVAHIQPAGKSNTRHAESGYSGKDQLTERLENRTNAQASYANAQRNDMMSRKVETAQAATKAKHALSKAKRDFGTETGLINGWMQQTVKLAGQFVGHGRVTHTFGPADYNTASYVVGIRTAGVWHLYGQRVAGVRGPIQGVTQII